MTSIAVGVMVCSRGENFTHHRNQMKKLFTLSATVALAMVSATANPSKAAEHMCDFMYGGDPSVRISCTVRWVKGGRAIFIDNDSSPEFPRYLSRSEGGKFFNSGQNGSCLTSSDYKWQICPSKEVMQIMAR